MLLLAHRLALLVDRACRIKLRCCGEKASLPVSVGLTALSARISSTPRCVFPTLWSACGGKKQLRKNMP